MRCSKCGATYSDTSSGGCLHQETKPAANAFDDNGNPISMSISNGNQPAKPREFPVTRTWDNQQLGLSVLIDSLMRGETKVFIDKVAYDSALKRIADLEKACTEPMSYRPPKDDREIFDYLQEQLATASNAGRALEYTVKCLQEERDQLRAEVERLKESEALANELTTTAQVERDRLASQLTVAREALNLCLEAFAVYKRKGWLETSPINDVRKALEQIGGGE